ncbi:hypothetical protein M1843_09545 [Isoptericola sp. 4D.3]|uniref:Uncharacterized protein n=1 Tax=Isoptericola peretonis TaxID=2918523 RepID=A0ABT0J3A9_9MICO|nr:hypothetical protein [Isoptericola sp. 4D.3]
MTSAQHAQTPHQPQQPAPTGPAPAGISWPLVAGLASMALLWPLTGLTGIGGTGAPRALGIVALTAVVWIGVVGFGRVPRPVLTLTLTGLAFGVVALAVSTLVGGIGLGGDGAAAWTAIPALAMDAGWGALAGVVALGIQKARGGTR